MNKRKIIKQAKSTSIMSVAEVSLSYQKLKTKIEPVTVSNSRNAHDFFMANCYDKSLMNIKEYFYLLLLNRSNKIVSLNKISEGGINGTVVDMRLILTTALLQLSSGVIAIHNHPSGSKYPSKSDKELTEKIKNILRMVDIVLMDHIIVTENDYFSIADEGLIN